jgi:hypothetical protein
LAIGGLRILPQARFGPFHALAGDVANQKEK